MTVLLHMVLAVGSGTAMIGVADSSRREVVAFVETELDNGMWVDFPWGSEENNSKISTVINTKVKKEKERGGETKEGGKWGLQGCHGGLSLWARARSEREAAAPTPGNRDAAQPESAARVQ